MTKTSDLQSGGKKAEEGEIERWQLGVARGEEVGAGVVELRLQLEVHQVRARRSAAEEDQTVHTHSVRLNRVYQ